MACEALTVYTIGHSNVPAERIVSLLLRHDVQMLADVRSAPYSRFAPQFNRGRFPATLQHAGLDYEYLGDRLGGRPTDPACYRGGTLPAKGADFLQSVDYGAVMQHPWFQEGMLRLLELAAERRTAVMCSEGDPRRCHRQHLVACALLGQGVRVLHILPDGSLLEAWREDGASISGQLPLL